MRKAILDVGSNSVLLLVADLVAGEIQPVLDLAQVTALGAGTAKTKLIGETGMADTLAAIRTFWTAALDTGAESVVAGGTMALRIATNAPDFFERAQEQGTPVQLVTADQESEWGLQCALFDPRFAQAQRVVTIDPGGHSTEVCIADRDGAETIYRFRHSFPVGALGIRDEYFESDAADPSAIFRASLAIDQCLAAFPVPQLEPITGTEVVVFGATATNLVSIRERLTSWDPEAVHGQRLTSEEVARAASWLLRMTDEERKAIVGIEPGRERSLPSGSLILERILHALSQEACTVSVRGWRHAALQLGALSDESR